MQLRIVSALTCSLIALGAGSSSALAANSTGGAAPTTAATAPATATKPALHLFRVTAHSRSLKYSGPVYVKTTTGEVVPFVAGSGTATTGSAASATGGAAPTGASSAPVTTNPFPPSGTSSAKGPTVRPQLLVPGTTARYVNGLAAAPMEAPAAVQ